MLNQLSARIQPLTRSRQLILILHVFVTIVLWVFVWMHAFAMDMTHDEAYSFKLVKTNYWIALFGTANTHWLNSIFMKLFNILLGDDPGYLRLQSVLAFPFFALAIYRLSNLIKGIPGQLIFYALILFNPYILDFFSVARGYGLALTFQAWSIVYFVKASQTAFRYRLWFMVFMMNALTIASNLSYLYTVLGMAGFYGSLLMVKKIVDRSAISKEEYRLSLLYIILILGTMADLLFIKYYGKDLGFGGDTDLVYSMVETVWKGSLYQSAYSNLAPVLSYISFFLMVVISAWYSIQLWRSKKRSTGFILSIPFISIVILSILFHFILNNPYLYGRTALQWYVPGILIICFAAGESIRVPKISGALATGFGVSIFVLQATYFYYHADKRLCFEWHIQANSRQALYDLYAQKPQHPRISQSVGGVYGSYYSVIDSSLAPCPGLLPEEHAQSTDTALRRSLFNCDYIITYWPVTIQSLKELGLRYDILKTYPPGNNKLLRIYH